MNLPTNATTITTTNTTSNTNQRVDPFAKLNQNTNSSPFFANSGTGSQEKNLFNSNSASENKPANNLFNNANNSTGSAGSSNKMMFNNSNTSGNTGNNTGGQNNTG